MRLKPLTVLLGVLLLGAAGCAEPGSSAGSQGPETGSGRADRASTPPGEPSPSVGERRSSDTFSDAAVAPAIEPDPVPGDARIQPGEPLPPERLDTSALPRNYPRKVNVISGGQALAVVARESGCGQATVEIVEQTARRVVLLFKEVNAQGQGPCATDIRMPTVTVWLDEPLGSRTVELRVEDN